MMPINIGFKLPIKKDGGYGLNLQTGLVFNDLVEVIYALQLSDNGKGYESLQHLFTAKARIYWGATK